MYDFTFFTMPQGINRCKGTKKRRNKRSLLFFLDNIIFFRKIPLIGRLALGRAWHLSRPFTSKKS